MAPPPGPVMRPGPVHPGYGPPLALLAAPSHRLYARLVDFGVLIALVLVVLWAGLTLAGDDGGARGANALWALWCALGYLLLYDPLAHWLFGGRTLGKWLFGVRVVRLHDGGPVGLFRALGREWFYLFGSLFAGFAAGAGFLIAAWCLWDTPFKQGLHDKVVDTVVIRSRPAAGG
ncbi:RDD family protein [Streptomyces sp. AA0539]|nr:RDD family protein [Streptomyces sp. AA0539]